MGEGLIPHEYSGKADLGMVLGLLQEAKAFSVTLVCAIHGEVESTETKDILEFSKFISESYRRHSGSCQTMVDFKVIFWLKED